MAWVKSGWPDGADIAQHRRRRSAVSTPRRLISAVLSPRPASQAHTVGPVGVGLQEVGRLIGSRWLKDNTIVWLISSNCGSRKRHVRKRSASSRRLQRRRSPQLLINFYPSSLRSHNTLKGLVLMSLPLRNSTVQEQQAKVRNPISEFFRGFVTHSSNYVLRRA